MQGTEKTDETLNIFLEYVPGGSIASLLAKFGMSPVSCNVHLPFSAIAKDHYCMTQSQK